MSDHNRIVTKGMGHFSEGAIGATGISPGMAIEHQADGKWDPMASAQAAALKRDLVLAIEDRLQGKTVDDAYGGEDERVFFYHCRVGDHVQVLVKDGETIAIGDDLVVEGGGSGLFVEAAGTEAKFQLEALEAVSPSGANALCLCEVKAS